MYLHQNNDKDLCWYCAKPHFSRAFPNFWRAVYIPKSCGGFGQVVLGRGRVSEELYSMLQGQLTANSEPDYLKVEQAISLTAESAEACQLVPCSEWIAVNVLMSAIWIDDALAGNWKSKDKVSRSQSQRSSAVDAGRGSPARPQSAKTHHSRSGGLWGADLKHTHSRWEESRWRWL